MLWHWLRVAKIMWSTTVRSIASAARASVRVARQSAGLGVGSPLGWLCASRMPALPSRAASAMIRVDYTRQPGRFDLAAEAPNAKLAVVTPPRVRAPPSVGRTWLGPAA